MYLCYATRDGQSRRIAERIAGRLAERGVQAVVRDLAEPGFDPARIGAERLVVVVAAIRYGRSLPEAEAFLATFAALPGKPDLVLLSVNLTARKPGKDTVEGNAYLRKTIARHRLAPVLARAIAGRLDYSRYRWPDRQMIRLIMLMTGGPTDPVACVEYTDWDVVYSIAGQIAEMQRGR